MFSLLAIEAIASPGEEKYQLNFNYHEVNKTWKVKSHSPVIFI